MYDRIDMEGEEDGEGGGGEEEGEESRGERDALEETIIAKGVTSKITAKNHYTVVAPSHAFRPQEYQLRTDINDLIII